MTSKDNNTLVKQALAYVISKEDARIIKTSMTNKHEVNIRAYLEENENIWNISLAR